MKAHSTRAAQTSVRPVRVLTKYRKNEALIRNDGVYVISGIFCRANACVCGKMHSRPDRWPQIVRFASGRADSLANQRFVNDQSSPGIRGAFWKVLHRGK